MERLEPKKIHGHTYYYYSKWAWVDGKCRRVWQKYLGKLEDIAKAVEGFGPAPKYAEIFQWGLPNALWKECCIANVVEETNKFCAKRKQGLSPGEYLSIAAINRAMSPNSKRSMWDWFSQTILLRHISGVSKAALSSQRFWDHMDMIKSDMISKIWMNIIKGVVERENIALDSISYDGTNFYTFIDTFNTRCKIAKRGKNKQGRDNLRQVSYALFCSSDRHIPLYFDVYEGNRHDCKEFPLILNAFHKFLNKLSGKNYALPGTTLIFDKGNNSKDNFALIDSLNLHFVSSVKLEQYKDLAQTSNHDPIFTSFSDPELEGSKAFRVTKKVYGRNRILVVVFNQNLFNLQWLTIQRDIAKCMEKLSALRQKLEDRTNGIIKSGTSPTKQSVEKQCKTFLSRQYMKDIIKVDINEGVGGIPQLEYAIDSEVLNTIANTYLGKNILFTSRDSWDDGKIIKAYRSQFIIEDVFKEMKDRTNGSWWPVYHWTDSKIKIHGLYCTIAMLLRAVIVRRLDKSGIKLSIKRILQELNGIREVVNIYPGKGRGKKERKQTVLTKTSELQQKLISVLKIKKD